MIVVKQTFPFRVLTERAVHPLTVSALTAGSVNSTDFLPYRYKYQESEGGSDYSKVNSDEAGGSAHCVCLNEHANENTTQINSVS